jgi:hypothetical protein
MREKSSPCKFALIALSDKGAAADLVLVAVVNGHQRKFQAVTGGTTHVPCGSRGEVDQNETYVCLDLDCVAKHSLRRLMTRDSVD